MVRRALLRGILLFCSLMLAFGAGEWFVRWQGARNADGTFHFRGLPIRPYALPVKSARAAVDAYLSSSSSFLVYDPYLGWSHRPNARTSDLLHRTNSAGLRADREYGHEMRSGMFRVAMFGDSFILGSEVDQSDAPGAQLERLLKLRGLDAEVLNFGVGGFGFDQAYLRYRRDGSQYDTSVVVQGLQLENIGRNVTIFRIVAVPATVIPFSKPRYVLRNGTMELVNQPAVRAEDVPATLANFRKWPLAKYEASYAERYERHWYTPSLLISTLVEVWNTRNGAQTPDASGLYAVDGEGMNITVRLLEAYRHEVTSTGKPFVLVYLPRAETISAGLTGRPDPWQAHRDRLRGFTIVDPSPAMVRYAKEHGIASLIPGHYSSAGYRIVAEALADALLPLATRQGQTLPPAR
jgi:hypothetical protein